MRYFAVSACLTSKNQVQPISWLKKSNCQKIVTICLSLIGLMGCNDSSSDNAVSPKKSKVKSNLVLTSYRVSMDADYPPYSFRDEKGNAIGFDVDMLRMVGEVEGFGIDIEPMTWKTVMPAVSQGKSQIGIGGIGKSDIIEEGLADKLLVSETYTYGRDAVAIRADDKNINIQSIDSLESLKNLRVVTLEGTGYLLDIQKLDKTTKGSVTTKPTTFLAYKDLFNNQADIVLSDNGVLHYLSKNNPKFPIVIGGKGKYFDEPYGMVFVVDKNHPELQAKINHGINKLIANGTYQQIHLKWFGIAPVYIPGKFTPDKHAELATEIVTEASMPKKAKESS